MKKSIETIWKEGFMDDNRFTPPEPADFQKQSSIHLIDKIKRRFKFNLLLIVIFAFVFLIILYFMHAFWQGMAAASMLLGLAGYSYWLMKQVKTLDQGLSSYDYLKAFDDSLTNALSKNEKVMRIFYPLMFVTAMCIIWFANDNQKIITQKLYEIFPDMIFVWGVPLIAVLFTGVAALVLSYFSDKIFKWDVLIVYGRIFRKLRENIAEMEKLR